MNSNIKDENIEYIRAFCIIAVITIHTLFQGSLIFSDSITEGLQIVCDSIINIIWWAVPCFLMVTGALLLDIKRKLDIKKLYSKYILRMLAVLFVFGGGFAWIEIIFDEHRLSVIQIGQAFLNVVTGNSWEHMWYIYGLIGIYLLLPVYKLIAFHATNHELIYILSVLVLCQMILPISTIWGIELNFYCHIGSVLPLYILMGIAWNRKIIQIQKRTAVLLLFGNTILILILTYFKNIYMLNIDSVFGYSSIIVLGQAIAIFNLIYKLNIKNGIIRKALLQIADKSFGIYLIHMFFLNLAYKFLKFNLFSNFVRIFILVVMVLLLSYIGTLIMRKIPLIKRIV